MKGAKIEVVYNKPPSKNCIEQQAVGEIMTGSKIKISAKLPDNQYAASITCHLSRKNFFGTKRVHLQPKY